MAFAYGMTITTCEKQRECRHSDRIHGQDRRAADLCQTHYPGTAGHARYARGTLPRMSEPHLSPQAYERLRQELDERTTTRRREISLWIERAREHGDISENADYDAAKNEQGHNEARVRQLEAMLKNAVVIDTASAGDVVEPGVLVELRHDGDDDAVTYLVGSIEERHDNYDVLSTESPLGQALLGAGPGRAGPLSGPEAGARRHGGRGPAVELSATPAAGIPATERCGSRDRAARAAAGSAARARRARCGSARRRATLCSRAPRAQRPRRTGRAAPG